MNRLFTNIDINKIMRHFVFFLMLLGAALLHNTAGLILPHSYFRVYFTVLLTTSIAMHENELSSVFFGFLGGVFLDVFSPYSLGASAVLLMVCALFVSLAVSHFLRSTVSTGIIFSAASLVIYAVGIWLFNCIFNGAQGGFSRLFTVYLPNALASLLFAPLIFIIVSKISKVLANREA